MTEISAGKSKVTAGLLAIFPPTGALGVHRFYLGYKGLGILHVALLGGGIILSLVIIGIPVLIGNLIWAIIEGVMILGGSISKDAAGNSLI